MSFFSAALVDKAPDFPARYAINNNGWNTVDAAKGQANFLRSPDKGKLRIGFPQEPRHPHRVFLATEILEQIYRDNRDLPARLGTSKRIEMLEFIRAGRTPRCKESNDNWSAG